jgi:hypothetical protein
MSKTKLAPVRPPSHRRHVVIIGAGFGGLSAAKARAGSIRRHDHGSPQLYITIANAQSRCRVISSKKFARFLINSGKQTRGSCHAELARDVETAR